MKILISILVNGLIVCFLSWLLAGVSVDGYLTAIIVSLLLGIVNYTIRPVLTILTFPLTIITLGLFLLVINGLMVLIVDWLLPGFHVNGLVWGIVFTIMLIFVNFFIGGDKVKMT